MNKFGLILRDIVFFLFPVPFLLGFAIGHHGEWTAYVAYTVIVVLVLGGGWTDCGSKKALGLVGASRHRSASSIYEYTRHNQNPRPFKWTKSADQILASVKRFCHKAQQTLCGEL